MSPAARKILVVEDEGVLRASLVAGLGKLRDVRAVGAGTLTEALPELDDVDMVVSDIDLPDGLGVQLLGELAKRKRNVPTVFITAYRAAYGTLVPPHSGATLMEKPVSLDALRRVVTSRLGTDAAPAPFGVTDYVQLACMGRHSVAIDVEWTDGAGHVEIHNGELWSANDPQGGGVAAFRRLAFRREVAIRCSASDGPTGARNIEQPWEGVLMDSAREFDEAQRESTGGMRTSQVSQPIFDLTELGEVAGPPSPANRVAPNDPTQPSVTPVDPRAAAAVAPDPFAEVYDMAIAALLAKDYAAAATLFERAHELRKDDVQVAANLRRLGDMGYGTSQRRES